MEQFDTPPTFESEQVQPTEMERLVDRMQNFSIGLTPATAQATLATVTRGLEQGMFKIEELDAIITIREEVNKGIIEYNGQMKQAQERMQVLQQEEVIKQQEEIANRIERERVKVRDERQLRKSTQDRLKLMEDALAKAGITIDLDGDGVIGLPAGEGFRVYGHRDHPAFRCQQRSQLLFKPAYRSRHCPFRRASGALH